MFKTDLAEDKRSWFGFSSTSGSPRRRNSFNIVVKKREYKEGRGVNGWRRRGRGHSGRERERVRGRERERAGVAIARSTANRGEEPDGSGTEQTDRPTVTEKKTKFNAFSSKTLPAVEYFYPNSLSSLNSQARSTEWFHWF